MFFSYLSHEGIWSQRQHVVQQEMPDVGTVRTTLAGRVTVMNKPAPVESREAWAPASLGNGILAGGSSMGLQSSRT